MTHEDPKKVGYRRPPQQNQFKPGQSGNPNGRPKGARNLENVVREELEKQILVKESGRSTKVSAFGVIVRQTVNKAAAGDLKALDRVLSLLRASGLSLGHPGPDPAEQGEGDPRQAERDAALIDEYMRRYGAAPKAQRDIERDESEARPDVR